MSTSLPTLSELGPRIVICGPAVTGKSTLTVALSRALAIPAFHLDMLDRSRNRTMYDPLKLVEAHSELLRREECWIIDGNYPQLMEDRLRLATGAVLLSERPVRSFTRYLWRTLVQRRRFGTFSENDEIFRWEMLRWIFVDGTAAVERYRSLIRSSGVPAVEIRSMKELRALYEYWALPTPKIGRRKR